MGKLVEDFHPQMDYTPSETEMPDDFPSDNASSSSNFDEIIAPAVASATATMDTTSEQSTPSVELNEPAAPPKSGKKRK